MEDARVLGMLQDDGEVTITLSGLTGAHAVAALFGVLAVEGIAVGQVEQDGARLVCTVARADRDQALAALAYAQAEIGFGALDCDADVVRLSLLGCGLRTQSAVT